MNEATGANLYKGYKNCVGEKRFANIRHDSKNFFSFYLDEGRGWNQKKYLN